MWIGDVVADRFVIEQPIGSGGMGSVFRALDRDSGARVALKVLDLVTADARERFQREARVLSGLSHPGIVRYIAHGESRAGEPFLVMELLAGKSAAERLTRGALSLEDGLLLVRRAAEALAFAHGKGIVHRDVKPGNLFLVDGEIGRVKVLDFGIARSHLHSQGLTQTGALLGTVGYMAPEQAAGDREVNTQADVFALGCVLFECLAGRRAFDGKHVLAILAKVMTQEPPRMSELRPGLGKAIDSLLARMLAKQPEQRFEDAGALLAAMDLLVAPSDSQSPMVQVSANIAQREQRVVSAILIELDSNPSSLAAEQEDQRATSIAAIVARFGANHQRLSGGAGICLFSGEGTAMDQAERAAGCALALWAALPELRIALATGRAETDQSLPVGQAIDAAATLLRRRAEQTAPSSDSGVLVDELTAGLLERRFEVEHTDWGRVLRGERADRGPRRMLMGIPTPTVGREKEVALLELTLDECISDRVARGVVVTAPPGVGKSRLLAEFDDRARTRAGARICVARGEATAAKSPLGIAGKLVREAALLREIGSADSRARLRGYLAERVGPDRLDWLLEFLGEVAGVPSDREPSGLLRAARNDPTVMREQKRRAFEAWLDAELSAGALVIVVEDLHWADAPSMGYLEEALQRFSDRSLMVVALGRPEALGRFPQFRAKAAVQEVRLGGLTHRAAQRLVRCILGEAAADEVVAALVEKADGNAFYLEELIRFAAGGRRDLPDTVIAVAQTRLETLEAEARQVLRAVSVAGDASWVGCVTSLTGDAVDAGAWLEVLADREILVRAAASRFLGEREFAFRHTVLRDAAYAMLTDRDRSLAHRATGEWLERAGEQDSRVLAEHFEKGGDTNRAIQWIARAVRAALEAGDMSADALALHGIELGASGESLGELLVHRAQFALWRGELEEVLLCTSKCMPLIPQLSSLWWLAASGTLNAAGTLSRPEAALPVVLAVVASQPSADPSGTYGMALQGLVSGLVHLGNPTGARELLDRFRAVDAEAADQDLLFRAMLHAARNIVAFSSPSPSSKLWELELAWQSGTHAKKLCEEIGHDVALAGVLGWIGLTELALGRSLEAEQALSLSSELAAKAGADWLGEPAALFCTTVAGTGPDVARAVHARVRSSRNVALISYSCILSAELHLSESKIDAALVDAKEAVSTATSSSHRWAHVTLARVELALGRPRAALEALATAASSTVPIWSTVDGWLHLLRAQALHALGEVQAARDAIDGARVRLVQTAKTFTTSDLRAPYLSKVEPHRRTIELAREWLGESELLQ